VLKELPENQSANFDSKTIKITFDEFVVLANPNDNIFFSPPLEHAPSYLVKGKSLIVKINDTLRANKTYNIAFTNAIKDYTEGNVLPFYLYSFSTGNYIDTFMINGKVVDAKTIEPLEGVLVLLYDRNIDTLPYSELPTYITKTQKDGKFDFRHISEGDYKIIALKDINNNLLYDLSTEGIAFLDQPVSAKPMRVNPPDSLSKIEKPAKKEEILTLSLFVQEDTVQRLLKMNTPQSDVYLIPYRRPFQKIQSQSLGENYPEYFERISDTKDTLFWYFKQPVSDTLLYEITLENNHKDTITLMPYKAPQQRGRGKQTTVNPFAVRHAHAGNIFKSLQLNFSLPILKNDSVPVVIITSKKSGSDTTLRYYSVTEDYAVDMLIPFAMEEKVPYTVMIRDSVFTTFNGFANDTILISFNSKSEKDFGNLLMEYEVPDETMDYIVILEDSRGNLVQQDVVNRSRIISYMHLLPGDYKIKVIEDQNKNGKWDTGNYHQKRQPEKLYFYEKKITVRGYWDLEEEMKLGK
ncbi:Ig-like domain-containing protein, partial [Bacteroidales bacterium OttesenSCG-928-C03]|nr:Ig-like domain-containing protein [Bacteroidales bacterium OttesenSCG-928-C03]